MKRRKFIRNTALSMGALAFPASSYARILGANDRINIGLIGAKGMGWADTHSLLKIPGTELIGMCDVDKSVLAERKKSYAELRDNKVKTYKDYRKLLGKKDLDLVVIGTPDHWHCKMLCDAVDAGKHAYVEKPIANSIEECYIMKDAVRKSGKIVQVGQWQRSGTHYADALKVVRSGVLGNIRLVKCWAYQGWLRPMENLPDAPVPKGVDYDMWLGPAPKRPFNPNRFHFTFRWFWDYAGGLMTDWGVHELDIALYAMGADTPVSVMASGGKFAYPDDPSETPDTLQAVFEFKDFNLLWEHAVGIDNGPYGEREGIAFIGNNGTLMVNRDGYRVMVEREQQGYSGWGDSKMEAIENYARPDDVSYLDLHTKNFIQAIDKNDSDVLATNIWSGSSAAICAQMGNIAFKTGQKIYWDDEAKQFKDNKQANELINATYHNGWKKPRV